MDDTVIVCSTPVPNLECHSTDMSRLNEKYDTVRWEIERLRAEVAKHSELIRANSENADHTDLPDPSEDFAIWNLNTISVLMWKCSFWPTGRQWNHDREGFESRKSFCKMKIRSRSQRWMESSFYPLVFTLFPMVFVFAEMCILSGIIDQGSNVKSHIYGDGYYQSPTWRYSSAAYLRVNFVPLLSSNGSRIGMTSNVDTFNHSMLRDRPESEAAKCLNDDYLMPFNRYKVHDTL